MISVRLIIPAGAPPMLCQLKLRKPGNLAGGGLLMKQAEQVAQCCSQFCYSICISISVYVSVCVSASLIFEYYRT